jgi:UDP-N-acetylglucosamine 2-epimerase
LVTAHRRENHGQPIANICEALREIASRFHKQVLIIYPVHLNPAVDIPVRKRLSNTENIILTSPLEYELLIHLLKRSYFVMTDSGGLQEEAPALSKPVLILREATERPEVLQAGTGRLIGTDRSTIIENAAELLNDRSAYEGMAHVACPFGDGTASKKITQFFLQRN